MKIAASTIEKVRKYGIYDTKKYRYIGKEAHDSKGQYLKIMRIENDCLDTTAALSDKSDANPFGWELVHIVR